MCCQTAFISALHISPLNPLAGVSKLVPSHLQSRCEDDGWPNISWVFFNTGLECESPFYVIMTRSYSPRLLCSCVYLFAQAHRKRKCFELRGRHTSTHQTHIFWSVWWDMAKNCTLSRVHSKPCHQGVAVQPHFLNDCRCLYKSDLCRSSDSCNLTAGGMIGEMKWNELSRTSLATTKWVITHTWDVWLYQQTFVDQWKKKKNHNFFSFM